MIRFKVGSVYLANGCRYICVERIGVSKPRVQFVSEDEHEMNLEIYDGRVDYREERRGGFASDVYAVHERDGVEVAGYDGCGGFDFRSDTECGFVDIKSAKKAKKNQKSKKQIEREEYEESCRVAREFYVAIIRAVGRGIEAAARLALDIVKSYFFIASSKSTPRYSRKRDI